MERGGMEFSVFDRYERRRRDVDSAIGRLFLNGVSTRKLKGIVKDLYARATSQYDLVRLFRDDIIPKSEQTLEVSQAAYQVGDVDFLQLIDNWQQLLRFRIAYHRLESQVQQTLATLERVVGGQFQTAAPIERVPPALPFENRLPAPDALPPTPLAPPTQPQPGNS